MTNTTAEDRAAPVEPGTQAPDFELLSTPDQKVSLADFRGRPTILAFYPETAHRELEEINPEDAEAGTLSTPLLMDGFR